ncbi:Box C/D snoRNA protein 1 [Linnemannia zychae]|nr:Box C/D snoRNA protein 1 [Linnemannia zychae]
MDFFANAFVTRDVVDPKNMVVKDGIQIREKALSSEGSALAPPIPTSSSSTKSSSLSDVVNCEVCGVVAAKYKCPGCYCQTCSLACSKQHKLDTTCSGVRSRTHFVERKQYTEQDMMSGKYSSYIFDYNFLEEVGRTVDNAARENIKLDASTGSHSNRKKIFGPNGVVTVSGNNRRDRHNHRNKNYQQQGNNNNENDKSVAGLAEKAGQDLERLGAEGSGSYKDKQLILQAKKRGIHLIMMADGLKKRKENHTNWKDKVNKLNWTIEWLFPEIDSTKRILEHRNDDSLTLITLLTGTLSKDENKDIAEKYPIEKLDQCRLYFVIPLRNANQPALYPLSTAASLQEALKFKKILEYPTILVLAPNPNTNVTASTSITADDTTTETEKSEESVEATVAITTAAGSQSTLDVQMDIAQSSSTTTAPAAESHQMPVDHTHPFLKKYTIEEPPTQWPKKPTPTTAINPATATNPNKRPNNTSTAEKKPNKKAKVEKEDIEMSANSSNSESENDDDEEDDDDGDHDSDSDSDSDSSDDSNDSSSDDSSDSDDDESDTTKDAEEKERPLTSEDLKLGQAILEAFNQDFGSAE